MDEANGDGPLVAESTAQTKSPDVVDGGELTGEVRGTTLLQRVIVDDENLYAIWLSRECPIEMIEKHSGRLPVVAKGYKDHDAQLR